MNKIMRKTTFREIKSSLARYMAILAIVALGVGFFSGLKVTKPAMVRSADNYIKNYALFDYRLLSTLGFTQADVKKFAETQEISHAEGSIFFDFIAVGEDENERVLKAHSITESINKLYLIQGSMPQKNNECVVDSRLSSLFSIGDEISLSENNDTNTLSSFKYKSYKVTGFVQSPYYLNFERGNTALGNGKVAGFIYLNKDGFALDYYKEIFVTLKNTGYIFSDEYETNISDIENVLLEICEKRTDIRYNKIITEANTKIEEAQKKIDSSQQEYDRQKALADEELVDASNTLSRSRSKIRQTEQQLDKSESELTAAKEEIQAGLKQIAAQRAILTSQKNNTLSAFDIKEKELKEQLAQINEALAQITGMGLTEQEEQLKKQKAEVENALYELQIQRQSAIQQFSASEAQLDTSEKELTVNLNNIEKGLLQIQSGREELASAKNKLAQGQKQYNEEKDKAYAQFNTALETLNTAKQELADAREEVEKIEKPVYYALNRDTNVGYVCFKSDSNIVEGIANVFPVFFFLVAALVCMTTMNRMVDEQRTQIGILKALGYKKSTIMCKYIFYSGSAALLGCLIGFFAGSYIFPKVIWKAYDIMYGFAPIGFLFDKKLAVISLAVSLLCSAGATWFSCRQGLSSVSAELMRPKAPKSGKRIFLEHIHFIWHHLSFLKKVSVRNVVRYKKRFFMMILGIGGCTALLLTGLGIKDSIADIAGQQFGEIMLYDCSATFSNEQDKDAQQEFKQNCSDIAADFLFLSESSVEVDLNGTVKSLNMIIPSETDKIDEFISLHDGEKPISFPAEGEAVLSKKIAEKCNVSVGDNILIYDSDMNKMPLTVSGICDNYVYNYVYISPESCKQSWGYVPEYKSAFIYTLNGINPHDAAAEIMSQPGVSGVEINEDIRGRFEQMMESLDYIVILVILCAGALAFIVLYNLTNINITERLREIATLKVLGFKPHETASYVFRENTMLTAIGSLIGLILGVGLHAFVMDNIDVDMVAFNTHIAPLSFILAVILTFVFSGIVDLIMYSKLNKINMAESLKTVE